MFKRNLGLLDKIIVEYEKNPNAKLDISCCNDNDEQSSPTDANILCKPGPEALSEVSEEIEQIRNVEPGKFEQTANVESEEVELIDSDSSDFVVVPVMNPKGRPKSHSKERVYAKTKSNRPVINKNLLFEEDLCKRLLTNVDLVRHSTIYLTDNIILCFLQTLVKNLSMDIFVFDSINQIDLSKFDCNVYFALIHSKINPNQQS